MITELELLSFSGLDANAEQAIQAFLREVTIFDLAGSVKERAIEARRTHGLRLPDAIIVGTAAAHGLALFTNDERLLRRQIVPSRSVPLRS